MKLYYMELIESGANLYEVGFQDRHKIWVDHPNAKEISRKLYFDLQEGAKKLKQKETEICPKP